MIGLQGDDEFGLFEAMDIQCRPGVLNYSSQSGDKSKLRTRHFFKVWPIASLAGLTSKSVALVAQRMSLAIPESFPKS